MIKVWQLFTSFNSNYSSQHLPSGCFCIILCLASGNLITGFTGPAYNSLLPAFLDLQPGFVPWDNSELYV